MIRSSQWSASPCGSAETLRIVESRLNGSMAHPNLFILARGGACPATTALGDLLREDLACRFPVVAFEMVLSKPDGTGPMEYLCIAIDSSQPEAVRDAIKERLWHTRRQALSSATLADILHGGHEKPVREFRLEEYGLYIPCRTRRFADIRTHSFPHSPAYYRYRLALTRTDRLPEPMADYLHTLFTNCPNHLFSQTVCRASRVRRGGLGIEVPLTRVKRHDIIALASKSRGFSEVSSRHENLQKFFLEHNPNTIACEVPVWMEAWEIEDYPRLLRTRETLTGHIDVLRRENDGLLGVWDYKPHAAAERDAHVQVFLYALMLALRTGLPLPRFLAGYFDENDAYIFGPSQVRLTDES
jgi:hypothetical protein